MMEIPAWHSSVPFSFKGHRGMLYSLDNKPPSALKEDFMRKYNNVRWLIRSPQYAPEIQHSCLFVSASVLPPLSVTEFRVLTDRTYSDEIFKRGFDSADEAHAEISNVIGKLLGRLTGHSDIAHISASMTKDGAIIRMTKVGENFSRIEVLTVAEVNRFTGEPV